MVDISECVIRTRIRHTQKNRIKTELGKTIVPIPVCVLSYN